MSRSQALGKLPTVAACLALFGAGLLTARHAGAANLPANYTEVSVARPDGAPSWDEAVGITFSASGRMFVWERAGRIWIVDDAHPVTAPILDIGNQFDYELYKLD